MNKLKSPVWILRLEVTITLLFIRILNILFQIFMLIMHLILLPVMVVSNRKFVTYTEILPKSFHSSMDYKNRK